MVASSPTNRIVSLGAVVIIYSVISPMFMLPSILFIKSNGELNVPSPQSMPVKPNVGVIVLHPQSPAVTQVCMDIL